MQEVPFMLGYSRDCTLNKLAEVLTYDTAYLSRFFKRSVGITYTEYVNQYRISIACDMLTDTDRSILQCALDCGYASLRNFNYAFHSVLSISPSEYKKLKQG